MPSGITHILLAKEIPGYIRNNRSLKALLSRGLPFLMPGSVGPDLPYASIADGDLFFRDQSELADKLHHEKTNQPALYAFSEIKKMKNTLTDDELDALFCFFTGYAAHIIADGIMHPFVRDKVGDYEPNQSAHRILELKLDVIYLWYLTKDTGRPLNFNFTNIHDRLLDITSFSYRNKIFELYSSFIKEIYKLDYSPDLIAGWVDGLHRMFSIAEGNHPKIYKDLPLIKSYLFSDIIDLQNDIEKICLLTETIDNRPENFLKQPQVHFLEDCVPIFFSAAVTMIKRVYDYIYKDGPELTGMDILPGRS
jgi:hypothetical protein